jgi:hypothetical protein
MSSPRKEVEFTIKIKGTDFVTKIISDMIEGLAIAWKRLYRNKGLDEIEVTFYGESGCSATRKVLDLNFYKKEKLINF